MRKKNSMVGEIPVGVGLGLITGLVVIVLIVVITAVMIAGERIGEEKSIYGAMGAILLGTFAGTFFAAAKTKEKRFIVSIATGAALYIVLLCINAVFFEGMFENMIVTFLLVMGASTAAGLVNTKKNKGGVYGRKRRVRIP